MSAIARKWYFFTTFKQTFWSNLGDHSTLRGYGTLKYSDVHEKFNFLEIQDLRPLRTCQKHFDMILLNFLPDECEI